MVMWRRKSAAGGTSFTSLIPSAAKLLDLPDQSQTRNVGFRPAGLKVSSL